MKPILTLTLLLATSVAISSFIMPDNGTTVYVCTGPKSKCYHLDKNCRGLNNCSKTVRVVTLEEARKMGRGKPCKKCCK